MAMAISSITLSAKNDITVDTLQVTTTPQMHCSSCENKIKNNIRFVKGVKKIETSVTRTESYHHLRQQEK